MNQKEKNLVNTFVVFEGTSLYLIEWINGAEIAGCAMLSAALNAFLQ